MSNTTYKNNQSTESNEKITNSKQNNQETTTYFLSNDNFNKLREIQQEILKKTDIAPSIRKLANLLINNTSNDNIEIIKNQLITQLKLQSD